MGNLPSERGKTVKPINCWKQSIKKKIISKSEREKDDRIKELENKGYSETPNITTDALGKLLNISVKNNILN